MVGIKKFCPKCGASVDRGVFCSNCQERSIDFKPIRVKLCPSKRYFFRGKWTEFKDLKSLSRKLLSESIKGRFRLVHGLEIYDELLSKPGLDKVLDMMVNIAGEDYKIPVEVGVTYSPGYSKLGSTYFEGILQLRNARSDVKEYVKNYFVKNSARKVFVNKIVEKEDSVDYFFVNKKHIMPLALKIVRNFGGFVDPNAQLFSHNRLTSRDLYRVNVLVTVPGFSVGDAIYYFDNALLVRGTGKLISCIRLEDGKNFTFSFDGKSAGHVGVLKKMKSSVSSIHPFLEVIHPVSYQAVSAKNPLNVVLNPGQKVSLVEHSKVIYVVR